MPTNSLSMVGASTRDFGIFIAQNRRQSSLGLSFIPNLFIPLASDSLAIHFPKASIRLFGFSGKQRSIVVVGLANDVSQEVRIGFRCTRPCSVVCWITVHTDQSADLHVIVGQSQKEGPVKLVTHLFELNASSPTSSYCFFALLASCVSRFAT
jgi:hypothetical protein